MKLQNVLLSQSPCMKLKGKVKEEKEGKEKEGKTRAKAV